jgi:hypothetical protein
MKKDMKTYRNPGAKAREKLKAEVDKCKDVEDIKAFIKEWLL